MPNYMFDMNLFASIYIDAPTLVKARQQLERALGQIEFAHNLQGAGLGVTDVVVSQDDGVPELFEVDGEMVDYDYEDACDADPETTPNVTASAASDDHLHEFAFDVTLAAVVRIKARKVADALVLMENTVEGVDLSPVELSHDNVRLTEASVRTDLGKPILFEIDGIPTE